VISPSAENEGCDTERCQVIAAISQVYTRNRFVAGLGEKTVGGQIGLRWWMYFLISLLVVSPLAQATGQTPSANTLSDAQVRDKVSNLLQQMTLDEKIAQLSQLPILEFRKRQQPLEEILKQVGAGSVLASIRRDQSPADVAVEQSRLHIPYDGQISMATLHLPGVREVPANINEDGGRCTSSGCMGVRSCGIQWTFAPMVDIARVHVGDEW
jgi:hypothetical protein